MKSEIQLILIFLLLVINVPVLGQFDFPADATLECNTKDISYKDSIHVTYTLSGPDGYYYIGLFRFGSFEAVGADHWSGHLKASQEKEMQFIVRVREDALVEIDSVVILSVGFEYGGNKPLPDTTLIRFTKMRTFVIRDYDELVKALGPRKTKHEYIPLEEYQRRKKKSLEKKAHEDSLRGSI